jgi:NADPH2:quinone reductase
VHCTLCVNQVDIKSRNGLGKILGYDGAGVVQKAGEQACFKVGDEVFYSGVAQKNGTNAHFHVVDSRLVGPKPKSLDWAEAASYPLVALTAWEMFEGHFGLRAGETMKEEKTVVIVNGAGGVGSIATQLAKVNFDLHLIKGRRCAHGSLIL